MKRKQQQQQLGTRKEHTELTGEPLWEQNVRNGTNFSTIVITRITKVEAYFY
jgi:hypothetical protein